MPNNDLTTRRAIEQLYARLSDAICAKDLDALAALYAPDYRELQVTGEERDFAAVMEEWRGDLTAMIDPTLETEIHHIDLVGDKADVTLRSVQTFISAPSIAQRFTYQVETARRDRWTNTDAGWRLLRSERQKITSWIDGVHQYETVLEPALTGEQRAAVVRDLTAHALPIKTVEAGHGFDDLAGLDHIIGDARIVALGEASHGTAEFFQMKHRLVEYLVAKKGFTVFAIEGNLPEAQLADRFIKTGEGDAKAALAAMYFWTWQTQEVAAMLHWMREYNAARGARPVLSFAGFDMQVINVALTRVIDFLDGASRADRDAVQALYEGMNALDPWGTGTPQEDNIRFAAQARKALELIDLRRERLVMASTWEDYRDSRQAARVVLQAFERRAGIAGADRDSAMAANVVWLIEEAFPDQKIILWAHNGHIGADMANADKYLGHHLRARYGDQMVVLGFATHQGEVRAKRSENGTFVPGPPVVHPLAPAIEASVEALFHVTGVPRFILDFRNLPKNGAAATWLAKPRLHRSVGAIYDAARANTCYWPMRLTETYDGIIFIAQTTAAKALS